MLTSVMARAGQGVARYSANAVDFDGTNDYMARGADLSGMADGKAGTLSFWIRLDGGDGGSMVILANLALGPFNVIRGAANTFRVLGQNGVPATILTLTSNTTYTTNAAWRHILASWNLAATTGHLYINNADDKAAGATLTDDTIDYAVASANWGVGGSSAGANKLNGCLADVWFNPTYLDITVAANRAKFINQDTLKPVSLGSDGSLPTGTSPILYLGNPAASFQTNLGTGGDFTVTGTLTAASTSPSDG